jgi:hypothetical protein
MPITLDEAYARADRRVAAVRESPTARYGLREDFYREYGFGLGDGLGNAELAFLEWEIERGVLVNPAAPKPGSPWWRAVNEGLLRDGERAREAHQAGLDDQVHDPDVRRWITYLNAPSAVTWYRAHNGTVSSGYLDEVELARRESPVEQQFVNIVLYRVLFAQVMVEGRAFPERALSELASIAANPRLPAVEVLTGAPDFYPKNYPLTPKDVKHVLHRGPGLEELAVDVLDEVLILPHAERIYTYCAQVLAQPRLLELLADGKPVYPPAPVQA